MPRTKGSKNKAKPLTIDEQITQVAAHVEKLKTELAAAEEKLKSLTSLRDEEAMKELMRVISEKGMSIADVIALIKATEGEA